jgi:hypothetical protein
MLLSLSLPKCNRSSISKPFTFCTSSPASSSSSLSLSTSIPIASVKSISNLPSSPLLDRTPRCMCLGWSCNLHGLVHVLYRVAIPYAQYANPLDALWFGMRMVQVLYRAARKTICKKKHKTVNSNFRQHQPCTDRFPKPARNQRHDGRQPHTHRYYFLLPGSSYSHVYISRFRVYMT